MNLANQAHDRETYQYFVDQAQKLLNEDSSQSNQPLSLFCRESSQYQQKAA
ncbi:hypothetical protein KR100_08865 [Synechococcus sp. KORDI-100]|nr:hypothetical protein KR100_08865 [Synechococcus sp. KORDI-100]